MSAVPVSRPTPVRVRRLLVAVAALLGVLVLSGCRGDATVVVHARPSGSGWVRVDVRLDATAAKAMGDASTALATADLEAHGWAVSGLRIAKDGTGRFKLERSFRGVAEANAILDELTGPTGPFHGVRLRRDRGPLSTTIAVRGAVDLSKGLQAFGDAGLAALTGSGSNLGFSDGSVLAAEGKAPAELVHLKLRAELDGMTKTWALPAGRSTPVALAARRWAWELAIATLGIVAGLAGIWLVWRRPGSRAVTRRP